MYAVKFFQWRLLVPKMASDFSRLIFKKSFMYLQQQSHPRVENKKFRLLNSFVVFWCWEFSSNFKSSTHFFSNQVDQVRPLCIERSRPVIGNKVLDQCS